MFPIASRALSTLGMSDILWYVGAGEDREKGRCWNELGCLEELGSEKMMSSDSNLSVDGSA